MKESPLCFKTESLLFSSLNCVFEKPRPFPHRRAVSVHLEMDGRRLPDPVAILNESLGSLTDAQPTSSSQKIAYLAGRGTATQASLEYRDARVMESLAFSVQNFLNLVQDKFRGKVSHRP